MRWASRDTAIARSFPSVSNLTSHRPSWAILLRLTRINRFASVLITERMETVHGVGVQMSGAGSVVVPALVGRQNETDRSPAPGESPAKAPAPQTSEQLELALQNAEYLLSYAVEAAIEVEPDVAQRIIAARRMGDAVWDGPEAGALVAAITKLAAKLHPVTAETLRACREEAHDAINSYKWIVFWLAAFIIPLSMIAFIYTGISNTITADIKTANDLTVTLHTQLDASGPAAGNQSPPAGSLSQLQQFAVTIRAIYGHARQLNWFVLKTCSDPYDGKSADNAYADMQIAVAPPLNTIAAMQNEADRLTKVYQDVRLFATNVQDATAIVWGAVSTCILPVLYALLGACAYVLRAFSQQTEARTFAPSDATPARFIIAAIGGGVVGLFGNFTIGQGTSLSPLAVAFLIGYAADIFFSFLEGAMQNLRPGKAR